MIEDIIRWIVCGSHFIDCIDLLFKKSYKYSNTVCRVIFASLNFRPSTFLNVSSLVEFAKTLYLNRDII